MTRLLATAAGTGSPVAGWLLLAGTAVLTAAVYAASCWLWPFKACRRCDAGRIHRDDRKVFRLCHRCAGTGRRLRLGRHLWNFLARTRKDGS